MTRRQAVRAGGLIEVLSGSPGESGVSVETANRGNGRIESAHVQKHGEAVYVSGCVRREGLAEPHPAAHVDVKVIDSRNRLIETKSVTYVPRTIPHSRRGILARSCYAVRLASQPATDSTVRVVFHDGPSETCNLNVECAVR